jgi:hypothetical protein
MVSILRPVQTATVARLGGSTGEEVGRESMMDKLREWAEDAQILLGLAVMYVSEKLASRKNKD